MALRDVRIREVRPDDYVSVAAIWTEAFPEERLSATELAYLDATIEPPYRMLRLVAERDDGTVVGTAVYQHSVGSYHPHRFLVWLAVGEANRGEGIGGALYARLREELEPLAPIGLRTQVHADDARAVRFANDRGFVETKRDTVSTLELAAFQPDAWRPRLARIADAGVRLSSLAELAARGVDWRRPFFDVFATIRRDVPRSEPVAEIDYDWIATHAYEAPDFAADLSVVAIAERPPDREAQVDDAARRVGAASAAKANEVASLPGDVAHAAWIGMTQLWRGEDAATIGTVHTGLTGVVRAWRGRGVATALKIDALRRAKDAGQTWVTTDNDERNAAMLAINARLGFEPWATVASMALELESAPGSCSRPSALPRYHDSHPRLRSSACRMDAVRSPEAPVPFDRSSGILLHPTSLPGPHGIGTLGEEAFRFVDFLAGAGQRLWQVMPLGPTGYGDSPYQCFSAFAGNPYLVDLEQLRERGFVGDGDLAHAPALSGQRVDYGAVIPFKVDVLTHAAARFGEVASEGDRTAYTAFCESEAYWLDDFALFMALKDAHDGRPWSEWDPALRDRDSSALAAAKGAHGEAVERHRLWQWFFYEQWLALKAYANGKGVQIMGDIPIFIAYDSADAWAHRNRFFFDEAGVPTVVAGVPPDYFSSTGQRWGNPLYRWKRMEADGFPWWIDRFRSSLDFFDLVRVDHFRGFEAYWEIPADEPTAENGRWVRGPGQPLFDALEEALGDLPIVAEDLGVITPEVERLRDANDLPGMKVLQFAFAGDASDPYLPHNYNKNFVVYTGTHDNDTTTGWYAQAPEEEKDFVRRYLAREDDHVAWEFIRLAQASAADLAVFPLQDALELGSEARMNTPGKAAGNWSWRFSWDDVPLWIAPQLQEMALLYGRAPSEGPVDTPYRLSTTHSDVEDGSD